MQTIGDRLEEARKRQGISVREAAEATKVRSDFLLNFENNNFDYDLPDVYKRGFLRLYGKYLKIDTDKLMTDYQAVVLGSSKHGKRENREFFGRMDLPEHQPTLGGVESEPPAKTPHASSSTVNNTLSQTEDTPAPAKKMDQQSDSSLYWKIGMVVFGTVAIAILIGLMINALISSGDSPENELNTDEPAVVINTEDGTNMIAEDIPEVGDISPPIIIRSTGSTNLLVRQIQDDTILFNGTIDAGQQVSLDRNGPVRVISTDFQMLTIDIDGRIFKSPIEGLGRNDFN